MDLYDKLLDVCRMFRIDYEYLGYETIQMGNVNRTYKVNFMLPEGTPKSFLVQSVNPYAFHDPVGLMNNIDKVTEHIRAKNPNQPTLHFHHTEDRKTYVIDGDQFWRMTNYVKSVTFDAAPDYDILKNTGRAFGQFQADLIDFDINELIETIPGFHNTRQRYEHFIRSVNNNKMGRAHEVRDLIEYILSVQELACTLTDLQMAGELPLRVTHNDTKINNVLFHPETGKAMIVVDLDTVMPGLMAHDFGDAVRFAANFVEEDSAEWEKAGVDLDLYRAFTEGFLSMTADTMTEKELETLVLGGFVLAVELGLRFLADYLDGDLYFHIKYPDHNLVRARCQLALAKDMLKKMDEMERIIRDCAVAAKTK